MHDYYRIKPVEAPSDLARRGGDVEAQSIAGPVMATRMFEDGASLDYRCFADDIVVDFPSLQEAVLRIRTSFLGS